MAVDSLHTGSFIYAARKAFRISLAALAADAQISPSYLCLIETGRRPLTIPVAARLKYALLGRLGR